MNLLQQKTLTAQKLKNTIDQLIKHYHEHPADFDRRLDEVRLWIESENTPDNTPFNVALTIMGLSVLHLALIEEELNDQRTNESRN